MTFIRACAPYQKSLSLQLIAQKQLVVENRRFKLRKRNFVTVVVDLIPIPLSFITVCDLWSFNMFYCYCNFVDVNFPLQVTLVDAEYLQDYENLNSQPAQELISKFVTEVINMLLCCSSLGESSSQRAFHLNEQRN